LYPGKLFVLRFWFHLFVTRANCISPAIHETLAVFAKLVLK